MAKLVDTFRNPEAHVQKAIVAVDLTDSTKMKEEQPEANRLTTYGWFFDVLAESIGKYNGQIVKYLGDGLMAVFHEDDATGAINWSIALQEEMASARENNLVSCRCSVGIGFGEIVEFDSARGGTDYIGTVADCAFRLCSAANAIFVDTHTVAAASMTKVTAQAGRSVAKRRTAEQYQGPVQSIRLEGFSSSVNYHEILWENDRFSVKPEVATGLSEKPERKFRFPLRKPEVAKPIPMRGVAAGTLNEPPSWYKGSVSSIGPRFGFITGNDDDEGSERPDGQPSKGHWRSGGVNDDRAWGSINPDPTADEDRDLTRFCPGLSTSRPESAVSFAAVGPGLVVAGSGCVASGIEAAPAGFLLCLSVTVLRLPVDLVYDALGLGEEAQRLCR